MVAPKFGLYTQGVLQAGDTVTFEYFSVDGIHGLPADGTEQHRSDHHRRDRDADVRLRPAERAVQRHRDRSGRG